MRRTEPTEYNMQRCPNCSGTRIVTEHVAELLPYGKTNDCVTVVFAMPVRRCLDAGDCGIIFSDHEAEKAQEQALARYRRALCPTPNIEKWCSENQHLSPDLRSIINAWELHREGSHKK